MGLQEVVEKIYAVLLGRPMLAAEDMGGKDLHYMTSSAAGSMVEEINALMGELLLGKRKKDVEEEEETDDEEEDEDEDDLEDDEEDFDDDEDEDEFEEEFEDDDLDDDDDDIFYDEDDE